MAPVLSSPAPDYPSAAHRARLQGVVVVELVIDRTGAVSSAKLLRGLPLGLSEAALEAVKDWRYEPATLHGEPVDVTHIQVVRFHLE